jgi:hypothetical protein
MLAWGERRAEFTCSVCGEVSEIQRLFVPADYPTITLDGKEVNNTEEFEIFNKENGFNVTLEYHPDSGRDSETLLNCTEVHYLYNSQFGSNIALESNIHSDGGTRPVLEMVRIIIITANKHYESMCI